MINTIYSCMADEFGEIEFCGKSYALTGQASLTNRMFSGWWGDAAEGEEYTAEYSAPAMDSDENEFVARWQFEVIKGDELEDESGYDWRSVSDVIEA